MSFEIDFLEIALWIFQVLIFGILPIVLVVIFFVYLRKILIILSDIRRIRRAFSRRG